MRLGLRAFNLVASLLPLASFAAAGPVSFVRPYEYYAPGPQQGSALCNTGGSTDVTEANAVLFEQFLNETYRYNRTAASSMAMKQCLETTMITGNELVMQPGPFCDSACAAPYGPYDGYPDSPLHEAFSTTVLSEASIEEKRRVLATYLWGLVQNTFGVRNSCIKDCAECGKGAITPNRYNPGEYRDERIYWNQLSVNGGAAIQAGPLADRFQHHVGFGGNIWHELMHNHGFDHGSAPHNSIPEIVGACIDRVLRDSFAVCSQDCPAGRTKILNQYKGSAGQCQCILDPAHAGSITATSVITGSSLVAVDTAGRSYIYYYGYLYRYPDEFVGFGGPPDYASVVQLVAGGRRAFVLTSSGSIFRTADGVAAWEVLRWGGSSADKISADDLGTLYVLSPNTSLSIFKLGASSPTVIAPVSFDRVFAGPNGPYLTTSYDGNLWLYDLLGPSWLLVGSAGADFGVDQWGIIYGLTPTYSGIAQNRRCPAESLNTWVSAGGPASAISVGSRLFARVPVGPEWVEVTPMDGWQYALNYRVLEKSGRRWGVSSTNELFRLTRQ